MGITLKKLGVRHSYKLVLCCSLFIVAAKVRRHAVNTSQQNFGRVFSATLILREQSSNRKNRSRAECIFPIRSNKWRFINDSVLLLDLFSSPSRLAGEERAQAFVPSFIPHLKLTPNPTYASVAIRERYRRFNSAQYLLTDKTLRKFPPNDRA